MACLVQAFKPKVLFRLKRAGKRDQHYERLFMTMTCQGLYLFPSFITYTYKI